jgi:hypothetical protein
LKLAEPVERPRGGVVAFGGTFVPLCGIHESGVTLSAFSVRVTRRHRYRLPVDTVAPPTGLRTPATTRRSVVHCTLTTRFTPGANGRTPSVPAVVAPLAPSTATTTAASPKSKNTPSRRPAPAVGRNPTAGAGVTGGGMSSGNAERYAPRPYHERGSDCYGPRVHEPSDETWQVRRVPPQAISARRSHLPRSKRTARRASAPAGRESRRAVLTAIIRPSPRPNNPMPSV